MPIRNRLVSAMVPSLSTPPTLLQVRPAANRFHHRLADRSPEMRWGAPTGTPHVAEDGRGRSALRELEAAARLASAVLLALDHPAVAGQEAAGLEHRPEARLVVGQRLA